MGDMVLTSAHRVRQVTPRAGLPVLEVVLQQHLAQLVALQEGREARNATFPVYAQPIWRPAAWHSPGPRTWSS